MNSGLMFPKQGKKKRKRIKHPDSILQQKDGRCFLCMMMDNYHFYYPDIERHHVFEGKNRQASEEEGLTVYLCRNHHREGPEAVHRKPNQGLDKIIKRYAQAAWEQNHTHEEFREKFQNDYLN